MKKMKKIVFGVLLFMTYLVQAEVPIQKTMKSEQLTLKCDVENGPPNHHRLSISLILDEQKSEAVINGRVFKNVKFDQYRIIGNAKRDFTGVRDLFIETTFELDRITGKYFENSFPVTENELPLNDEQASKIVERGILPIFYGTCAKSNRLF
ncbi:hypothetical protein ACO0LD_31300 [Undibacterium sp. Ji83W]|uniref:hypothetical protein n=1 Tax=Undibacterium sp. Ji83W TaxID=3413043 RepID=UPI003BF01337